MNKRALRGERLVGALKHLESCESCRPQIKLPTRKEILSRIFDNEDEINAMLKLPLPHIPPVRHKK